MLTEVRPVQLWKAPSPMLVMLSGMVRDIRVEQPAKAPPPMLVTLSGMVEFLHPAIRLFLNL
jgi:hypothetical protein